MAEAIFVSDNGFVFTGFTEKNGQRDFTVVKTDTNGDVIWEKHFGSLTDDEANSIRQTPDGGYIVAGYAKTSGQNDGLIIKLDANGDEEWQMALDDDNINEIESIAITGTGDYIIVGTITTEQRDGNIGICKITPPPASDTVFLELDDIISGNLIYDFTNVSLIFSEDMNKLEAINIDTNIIDNSGLSIHVGANSGDVMKIKIDDLSLEAMGITDGYPKLSPPEAAQKSIVLIDKAINYVSSQRANIGALQNSLNHILNNLMNSSENLVYAESQIRDANIAKEVMEMVKNNLLSQASQSMLAQAIKEPEGIINLLR